MDYLIHCNWVRTIDYERIALFTRLITFKTTQILKKTKEKTKIGEDYSLTLITVMTKQRLFTADWITTNSFKSQDFGQLLVIKLSRTIF